MVTELFLVQTFVLRHPVLNLTLFLLQDLLPRYRKMASNESVVFMVSGISDDDRMTEEIFLLCNVRIILGDTRKSFYYPWCSWVWGVTSYFCPANSWTEVKRENDGGGGDKKNAERKKRTFKEYPKKSQIWKSETSPNLGTWLGIPWLGLVSLCQIWDFYGYSLNTQKYPKMGIRYFFLWSSSCISCSTPMDTKEEEDLFYYQRQR